MFAIIALIIAGAAVLSQTAPFPFLMEAFRPSRSLWRVDSPRGSPPTVYLTFDDGPNPLWTPTLLDALGESNVRGTFFLIDDYITPETEAIVRRIAEDGHAIGLHSKTRKLMILPPDELAGRLQDAADRIVSITGVEPCRLFRPHGGWRSATMYQGLDRIGYRLAGWTWGLWDFDWWRTPRADQVVPRLVDRASAGDIIVIHDGHHKNPRADRRHAPETVRRLVPELRARGFRFERLCEMGS
ncbi:MAG TPA: polysaccharide deacetylase family protein [Vicinamibacterales bacterium]|nr:polysaccharide deacetylase family protein [Vicinamibacterales bacterium]